MQALYLHKLKQEKEGKLGKGRKAKPHGKESGETRTNQSHSQKCHTNSNVAN